MKSLFINKALKRLKTDTFLINVMTENQILNNINDWINKYTVPYDTPILKSTVNIYTKGNSDLEKIEDLFFCRFVNYGGKRRIIIPDEFSKFEFIIPKFDEYDWNRTSSFPNLIDSLFEAEFIDGEDGILDDKVLVPLVAIKNLINFFKLSIDFDKAFGFEDWSRELYVENEKYIIEGDHYDYSAEYAYKYEWRIRKEVEKALKAFLGYEFESYMKYNSNYNPFSVPEQEKDFDIVFSKLNKDQVIKVMTTKCFWDDKNILDEHGDESKFIELMGMIDDLNVIKAIVSSMSKNVPRLFVYVANKLYNL